MNFSGEPYRPLFSLGALSGVTGVGAWLLYSTGLIRHPMLEHSYVMLFGFFLAFVSGFLMTALPRMSGSAASSKAESVLAFVIISLGVAAAFAGYLGMAYACASLQIIFIIFFAARGMKSSGPTAGPSPHFIFIPAGLLWALFGSVCQALSFMGVDLPAAAAAFPNVAVQQAFLLNLIVGLGGRLIPFLTHVQNISPLEAPAQAVWPLRLIFALLNISFFMEGFGAARAAWLMRALVLVYASIALFKFHLPRPVASFLGFGLRVSVVTMIAGYFLLSFLPEYSLALLHLIFIGGFSLITLMVATRVVLSHGGSALETERTSWWVAGAVALLLAAAFLRSFYFLPAAASLWVMAVGVWFYRVGRLVF